MFIVTIVPWSGVEIIQDTKTKESTPTSNECLNYKCRDSFFGTFCSLGPHLEKTNKMITYDDQTSYLLHLYYAYALVM